MSVRLEECAASMLAAILASTFAHWCITICSQFAVFLVVYTCIMNSFFLGAGKAYTDRRTVCSEKRSPLAAHLFEDVRIGVVFASCTEEVCAFMRLYLGVLPLRHLLPPT